MATESSFKYPGTGPDERTSYRAYSAFDIPADLRQLKGRWDVEATAQRIRNYRYTEEWLMMVLAGWVATIPELPVKTGLGKVVWECAQAADVLGKRLPELRFGRNLERASEAANGGFAKLIEKISEPEDPDLTIEKLTGAFDVLIPHMVEVYERNIRETDQIADAPTIELLDEIVRKHRRHLAWGADVLDRLCDTDGARERRRTRQSELLAALRACGGVTGELRDLH